MDTALTARGLFVRKGHSIILDGLNFSIRPGKLTGLVGPSGSGKTTLMRAIVGVQKYEGTLNVLGIGAGNKSLRNKIGYVTQAPAVYPDLAVVQNLHYFASIVGATKREIKQIIHTVELMPQEKQLVGSLSGGQKARVSLAIALLGKPDVLVLDEPTVGLDPILREKLWELFRTLANDGKTLIISSHVMDEAERCDDLLLMREGKVLWSGEKSALLTAADRKDVGSAFIAMIEGGKNAAH